MLLYRIIVQNEKSAEAESAQVVEITQGATWNANTVVEDQTAAIFQGLVNVANK